MPSSTFTNAKSSSLSSSTSTRTRRPVVMRRLLKPESFIGDSDFVSKAGEMASVIFMSAQASGDSGKGGSEFA